MFDKLKDVMEKLVKNGNLVLPAIQAGGKRAAYFGVVKLILEMTITLMNEAETTSPESGTGPIRKEAVMKAIREVYERIDPNLPWIPEPLESWVEKWLLDYVVPAFIEVVIGWGRKLGLFGGK